MKRKILISITVLIVIILGLVVFYKIRTRVPDFATYEEQEHYAFQRYKHFRDYIAHHPRSAKYKIGWQFALDGYTRLFERFPKEANSDSDDLYRIANCYFGMQDYENAIKYNQKGLKIHLDKHFTDEYLNPSFSEYQRKQVRYLGYEWIAKFHRSIANCYLKMGDPHRAIVELEKIINDYDYIFDESDWTKKYDIIGETYGDIAWIYYKKLNDYKKAVEIHEKVINIFPGNRMVFGRESTYIGDVYRETGHIEKAKEKYNEVIADFGDTANANAARRWLKLLESQNHSNPHPTTR